MKTLFLINIGNTNTSFALFSEADGIQERGCVATSELSAGIIPDGDVQTVIASVVPELNSVFAGYSPFFISHENCFLVDFSNVDAASLGADRIANAAALAKFAELPAICVDCGTAITLEAVGPDGRFVGGAIAPGRALLRKALNSYTSKLPLVELLDRVEPPGALGSTTVDAIAAGCDLGALGMVKELVSRTMKELSWEECRILATGGDAEYFSSNISDIEHAGPDFTLFGIAAIYSSVNQAQA